jgi:hypothetical protein
MSASGMLFSWLFQNHPHRILELQLDLQPLAAAWTRSPTAWPIKKSLGRAGRKAGRKVNVTSPASAAAGGLVAQPWLMS